VSEFIKVFKMWSFCCQICILWSNRNFDCTFYYSRQQIPMKCRYKQGCGTNVCVQKMCFLWSMYVQVTFIITASISVRRKRFISSQKRQDGLRDQHGLPFSVYREVHLEVKKTRFEDLHKSPSSVQGKNEWKCTSVSPYVFMTCSAITLFTDHLYEVSSNGNGYVSHVGRDSSLSIATRYVLDGRGSNPDRGQDFPHPSRPG
jgi:hypothetical protein